MLLLCRRPKPMNSKNSCARASRSRFGRTGYFRLADHLLARMDYLFRLTAKLSREIGLPSTQTVTMLS